MRGTPLAKAAEAAKAAVALTAVAVLAGCSGGGAEPAGPRTTAAAEVCGGFARDAVTAAALKDVMGTERYEEGASHPDSALAELRELIRAGQENPARPQGHTYCRLRPTVPDGQDLTVLVNGVAEAPGQDPRLTATTWYASGARAFATHGHAKVYFTCGPKPSDRGIVIETEVSAPDGTAEADPRRRTRLVTLANAAARHVAAELGCTDTELAAGVPAPLPAGGAHGKGTGP
ncbi:hypothetical protein ABZV60_13490 [Streptomyces sp. NPDC004787]|uniref:hypothetical protein n=1 Tax=Streptomyces sp. NPDC004787 TaxID=3154291 RepID=UPI0033A77AA5